MNPHTRYFIMLIGCLSIVLNAAEPTTEKSLGLSLQQGQVLLEGKPYRGMGANYFSLFSRILKDPTDRSFDDGLRQLAEAEIPFVRFMACAFWPVQWELYQKDKEAYFKRLDAVVRSAEKHGVGLIPSLFWNMATLPDLVGEPIDQLGNPQRDRNSKD